MSSKIRLVLAGLTAAALIGGVMAADPADAGKKKKKRAKAKSSKVVQVSKGGKAKAGNGGNGGAGGNSGNVNNTGNVTGGAGAPGDALGLCILEALPATVGALPDELVAAGCFPTLDAVPLDLLICLRSQADQVTSIIPDAAAFACGVAVPGPGTGGGAVFSGRAGDGGRGGDGGLATGGAGGNNSNSSSVTVTSDDHSIDVDK